MKCKIEQLSLISTVGDNCYFHPACGWSFNKS